jgi:RimJ/RimL family protein N-acetyltransferase
MLSDDRIILRAWKEGDIQMLSLLRNNLELQEMLMTQPRPNTGTRVREWLEEKSNREDGVFFVVADITDDQPLGFIQVLGMSPLHGTGNLGICLSPGQQRTGVGSDAIKLLAEYLRRVFGTRKLLLNVLADNEKAIAFYLKQGFVEAGRLHEHFFNDGQFKDVVLMEKFIT